MSRLRVLLIALLAGLLVFKLGSMVFGQSGITIRAKGDPLGDIMASVSRQGKVRLLTNADADKPITLHLVRASLMDALTSLAEAADTRLQLRYVLAPSRRQINEALDAFQTGGIEDDEAWKRFYAPFPQFLMTESDVPPDPRRERWSPRELNADAEPVLQNWLKQAAEAANAAVYVPADWNPEIAGPPKGGEIEKALPRLAKAAGGKTKDVFFLRAREPRPEGPPAENAEGEAGNGQGPGREPPPNWEDMSKEEREERRRKMEERMNSRIDQLPDGERERAKGQMNMFRKMFGGLLEMSEEERREKLQEILNRPEVQEEMFKRIGQRTSRTTPAKRKEVYRSFIRNGGKLTRGPGSGRGGGPGGGGRGGGGTR